MESSTQTPMTTHSFEGMDCTIEATEDENGNLCLMIETSANKSMIKLDEQLDIVSYVRDIENISYTKKD